jgi:hypothetical protein
LHLRLPAINAGPDGDVLLADIAVDLDAILGDLTIEIEVLHRDSCDLGKLTLLVDNAVDGSLEVIPCASHDVVVGHRSSVRIQPNEWKSTRAQRLLLRDTRRNRHAGSSHPGNDGGHRASALAPVGRKRRGDMSPQNG